MKKRVFLFISIPAAWLVSCTSGVDQSNQSLITEPLTFEVKDLSDQDYPDNPNIGFRSKNHREDLFQKCQMDSLSKPFHWRFTFMTKDSDTISLSNVDLSEFIPTIPDHIKSDEYLSYISCINQEWNRNQVRFNPGAFVSTIPEIVRVDLARNCLNAYLWEVILYVEEDGKVVPHAHGWFDFPHEKYAELFEQKNKVSFSKYQAPLEHWIDPESKEVNLNLLRKTLDTIEVDFHDLSDEMYPLKAARKKKHKEIIYPESFSTMRDLQSDSTLFATFSPPGFYNKKDPRKTELGRIYRLQGVEMYKVQAQPADEPRYEIQLSFLDEKSVRQTKLIIGGLSLDDFPVLEEREANKGWKNSMGIGNHTFYELYKDHLSKKSLKSPYYCLLLDEQGRWLDSHKIGIDGPIFHFSDEHRKILHLWLLSFERHALVGHYEIEFI